MIFSNKITQLKLNTDDNEERNNQAHLDFPIVIDEIETRLSKNHENDNHISKKINLVNSKTDNQGIKYYHGILQSNLTSSNQIDDYNNHMYFIKSGTIISSNNIPLKYCPYFVYKPSETINYLNTTDENYKNHYWCNSTNRSHTTFQVSSDIDSINQKYTYESNRYRTSTQAFTIRYSIEACEEQTINSNLLNSFIGISFLNQPLINWDDNMENLGTIKNETDGIGMIHKMSLSNSGNSTDSVIPKVNGYYSVDTSELNFMRVEKQSPVGKLYDPVRTQSPNYFYINSSIGGDISWKFNSSIGSNYTVSSIDLISSTSLNHFYEGSQINEMKIELSYDYGESSITILFYYNGKLVEKFVTGYGTGTNSNWFHINHLLPVIFCKAPKGMIKIHSIKFDMD